MRYLAGRCLVKASIVVHTRALRNGWIANLRLDMQILQRAPHSQSSPAAEI